MTSFVGIVPAGGKAERMGGLPKMLLPTPHGTLFEVLCERIWLAGPSHIFIDMKDKDYPLLSPYFFKFKAVPTYLYDETMGGAVLKTRGYLRDSEAVLFGMPDTYFEDADAFPKLVNALDKGADLAVGVFDVREGQHREGGMVQVYGNRVQAVIDKPEYSDLPYIWGILAWQPVFWQHMNAADPHVGFAIPRAIAAGLNVRAVYMHGGFWDCGTPERYFALIRHLTAATEPIHAP